MHLSLTTLATTLLALLPDLAHSYLNRTDLPRPKCKNLGHQCWCVTNRELTRHSLRFAVDNWTWWHPKDHPLTEDYFLAWDTAGTIVTCDHYDDPPEFTFGDVREVFNSMMWSFHELRHPSGPCHGCSKLTYHGCTFEIFFSPNSLHEDTPVRLADPHYLDGHGVSPPSAREPIRIVEKRCHDP